MNLLNSFFNDDSINSVLGISQPSQEAILKRKKQVALLTEKLIADGKYIALNGKYPKRQPQ
jgi:hypothetical protein